MTAYSPFLFPKIVTDPSSLAMRPLLIAGMTSSVVGGDGGINIAVVNDNPAGVLCAINPYDTMVAGDSLAIYWGTNKVFTKEVLTEDIDKRLFFYLPTAPMVPGWVDTVYYQLTRRGASVPDDPSSALRLLVKLNRPGGRDKDPKPGHSELGIVQLPDEIIRGKVDAEWAASGVPMTLGVYPDSAARDTIFTRWGSRYLTPHTVTQRQAEGLDPIVITATQADILAAGDGVALPVYYEIQDEVGNLCETLSQRTTVAVDAGAWQLDTPIIKQSFNGVIDLETLGYDDVMVQILMDGAEFDVDDTLKLNVICTPQTGQPLTHTQSVEVISVPGLVELAVPNSMIRAAAMGTVDAAFTLIKKDGRPSMSSKHAFADVVGQVVDLPAPVIAEVQGDTLDPDAEVATVNVGYDSMANGHLINLIWLGTRANGTPYVHEAQHTVSASDAEAKNITMHVDSEHITALQSGSLELFYRVLTDDSQWSDVSESERLRIKIEAVQAEFDAPTVIEAPYGFLDPIIFPDSARVRVDNKSTLPGDVLAYYWKGATASGSTRDSIPITTVSAGQPINFRVDRQFITPNISQTVEVRYSLKRAATGQYHYSQTLMLQVGQEIQPTFASVSDSKGPIEPNGVTFDNSVVVAGRANAYQTVRIFDGATPLGDAQVNAEGEWTHRLDGLVKKPYSLIVQGLYGTQPVSTPPWVFSVVETLTPSITSVTDSKGDVAPNGITFDTEVTLKGLASPNQRVRILDGAATLAEPVVLGTGEWTHVLDALTVKAYRLTVKALYGAEPESTPARVFSVEAARTPSITSVKDSKGDIAPDGITFDKIVYLEGKASANQKVRILDGANTLAELDVDSLGDWKHTLSTLTIKAYSLTIKGLYGHEPVSSPPRIFTVAEAEKPIISAVTDSRGPVAPNGVTFDTAVTISGTASPDQKVRLLDNTTPLAEPTANGSGEWRQIVSGLNIKPYSITALALYGDGAVSQPPRTFTVANAVTPTISSVTDSKGPVAQDGVTFDTTLTIGGIASPNQTVKIVDGPNTLGEINAEESGEWKRVFSNLTVKFYSLKAIGLYGANPESTPPRTFRIVQTIVPEITSVTDSKGTVAQDGTTFDKSVNLTGTASPDQKVQLLDGNTSLGEPPVNGQGVWRLTISNLTTKAYRLVARGLYGGNPESTPPQVFTVKAVVTPSITSITDSKGQVAQDGTTFDKTVTIVGMASPNEKVRLLDGTGSWGDYPVDGSGEWRYTRSGLTAKTYSLTARALYAGEPVSTPARRFRVADALSIDPTQMNLNGFSVKIPQWTKTGQDSLGNTDTRQPTGGTQPYSYASDNPAVASVTTTGKVTGNKNGSTLIHVTDKDGKSVNYRVAVTNVYELRISPTKMSTNESVAWMNSLRGQTAYNGSFLGDIARVYVRPTLAERVWLCHMASSRFGIFLETNYVVYGGMNINSLYFAWCLLPL